MFLFYKSYIPVIYAYVFNSCNIFPNGGMMYTPEYTIYRYIIYIYSEIQIYISTAILIRCTEQFWAWYFVAPDQNMIKNAYGSGNQSSSLQIKYMT